MRPNGSILTLLILWFVFVGSPWSAIAQTNTPPQAINLNVLPVDLKAVIKVVPKHHNHNSDQNSDQPAVVTSPPPPALPPSAVQPPPASQPDNNPQPATSPSPDAQPQAPDSSGGGLGQSSNGASVSSPDITVRVLTQKLGSERTQRMLEQIQNVEARDGHGLGSPSADQFFDVARPGNSPDQTRPDGSSLFQGGQTSAPVPVTTGAYKPATVEDAKKQVDIYGSYGGGVALEDTAIGLGEISSVKYDCRFNAFILNDRAVYFMKIPPKSVAVLCRAIEEDEEKNHQARVGVSLGEIQQIYGEAPKDSDLAWDLKMADHFLGDIAFAQGDWLVGYRFANDYKPVSREDNAIDHAVHFRFFGFQFQIVQEEVRPSQESFDAQVVPLSKDKADDGGLLPDYALISQGQVYPEYVANAKHIADNISYYRRERIIDRTFTYGEVAAFIRALYQADFDLEYLARQISE